MIKRHTNLHMFYFSDVHCMQKLVSLTRPDAYNSLDSICYCKSAVHLEVPKSKPP